MSGLPVDPALAVLFADPGRQPGESNRFNRKETCVEDAPGVKHPLGINLYDGLDGVVALLDPYTSRRTGTSWSFRRGASC